MSTKPISVSYSSASRYKTCPTKFFLSKDYKTKQLPSALPFGKAIESGVEKLLLGGTLDEALEIFQVNWTTEAGSEYNGPRPIYDNPEVEFYASDFDKNLIFDEDTEMLEGWMKECELDFTLHWSELFDNISEKNKDGRANERELKFYNRIVWFCCLVRGQTMLHAFNNKLLPKLTVMKIDGKPATQLPIEVKNEEGDKVTGFIDFIVYHQDYKEPIIADLKTAAYPYTSHALETSEQLRTYLAAKGGDIGSTRGGYIVLLKKVKVERSCDACGAKREGLAKNCKACGKGTYKIPQLEGDVQFITKDYAADELEEVLDDYLNVTLAIKNEVKFKNPANCMQYNRPCEFYEHCWGRKKLDEIAHLEKKEQKALTPAEATATVETKEST